MQQLSLMLRKPFEKATKEDIIKLVEKIEKKQDWSDWTKQHYKVTLKKFYKWLRGLDAKGAFFAMLKVSLKSRKASSLSHSTRKLSIRSCPHVSLICPFHTRIGFHLC